jgi:hypothetical protein
VATPRLELLLPMGPLLDKFSDRPANRVMCDFNIPLSPKDRLSRQKIDKETLELKVLTTDLMDLIDMYKILHPTVTENTFF